MLDNELWDAVGSDYDQEYEFDELLEKINSADFFRPFSERLLVFYNDVLDSNLNPDETAKDLQQKVKQKNIALSRGTINNWFSAKSEPKYGDNDRQRLFAVAFALELDIKQTERLFHKVFLDKAFNKRSVLEFIYLYCIYNKKPFSTTEKLISQLETIKLTDVPIDQTVQTQFIESIAMQDIDEAELLNFISKHPYNFALNNTSAKKYREGFLNRLTGATGLANEESKRRESVGDEYKNKNEDRSLDFLLYMITYADFISSENSEVLSIRSRFPRKEIYNQFPDKQTLSDKNPSSYMLRKDLILLKFYEYWVSDFIENLGAGNYDGFVDELNDILFDCGFSPLYIGNPYDWLFLYCSACSDTSSPLDIFRGILAQE